MIKAKTIRKFVGFVGLLIFLIPFTGFPGWWKDALTVLFGFLVFAAVFYKPIMLEITRLIEDWMEKQSSRPKTSAGPKRKPKIKAVSRFALRRRFSKREEVPEDVQDEENDEQETEEAAEARRPGRGYREKEGSGRKEENIFRENRSYE